MHVKVASDYVQLKYVKHSSNTTLWRLSLRLELKEK